MIIGPYQKVGNSSLEIALMGCRIAQVKKTKYLGVWIDSNLTWCDHIDYVAKKVFSKVLAIKRLGWLDLKIIFLLYRAFISPVFDYCDIIWYPDHVYLVKKLDRLYQWAMHMLGFPASSFCVPPPPAVRYKFHVAIAVNKIVHHLCPPYLFSTLTLASSISGRSLRNPQRLSIPYVRTNFAKQSFYFSSCIIWNSLPF